MAIIVAPGNSRNTHHIKLSSGGKEVGLILCDGRGNPVDLIDSQPYPRDAIKMYSGQQKHADLEPPFTPLNQEDWSGGRGSEVFEDDQTRFFDSFRADTTREGKILLGGQENYCTGFRDCDQEMPGNVSWQGLYGETRALARAFPASASYSAATVEVLVRRVGSPDSLRLALVDDATGEPAEILSFGMQTPTTDTLSVWASFSQSKSLNTGTTYHVAAWGQTTDDANNHWEIAFDASANGLSSADPLVSPATWAVFEGGIYFRVLDGATPFKAHFFLYKGQLYFATQPDDGSAGAVFMNGYRGACDSNAGALTKLKDATQTGWSGADAGLIAKIVKGLWPDELQNWREVTAGANGELTVSPAWKITHTTACDYVLLGSNRFTQVGGVSGISSPVTDVAVVEEIAYLACGAEYLMRRHREFNDSGTWKSTDSDCWAPCGPDVDFILPIYDPITSGAILWLGRTSSFSNYYRSEVKYLPAMVRWDDSSLGWFTLLKIDSAWDEQVVSNVASSFTAGAVKFEIKIGVIETIATAPIAGGTGYQVGDVLTLDDGDGSGSGGTVRVTAVSSGEVTEVELVTAGTDYTTGTKETTGGHGSDCTVNITAITSFTTGVIGSKAISSVDLRFTNRITLRITSSIDLDAGDLQLLLDNSANCASPVQSMDLSSLRAKKGTRVELTNDTTDLEGAEAIISLGLQLTSAQTKSFTLELSGIITAYQDTEPILVSKTGERITGIEVYGDPETAWVFSEGGVGEIRNNQYLPIPLRELGTIASEYNGRAHAVGDTYLYFSTGEKGGVQRYFQQRLDSIGLDRDAGLPANRLGPVSKLVSYPGRILAAVDGGDANYSAVYAYQGFGWHEIYRAPRAGLRIRNIFVQTIPGKVDRLWISQGADVLWIPISLNPETDEDFCYTHEAAVHTGRFHAGLQDVEKFWKSLKLATKNLSSTVKVAVDYRTDSSSSWTALGTAFTSSPYQEVDFSATHNISGKWIELRLRLQTEDNSQTPVIFSSILECLTNYPTKDMYTLTFLALDRGRNLLGEPDGQTAVGIINQLRSWIQDQATPILMNADNAIDDNKYVRPTRAPVRRIKKIKDENREGYICEITLVEV